MVMLCIAIVCWAVTMSHILTHQLPTIGYRERVRVTKTDFYEAGLSGGSGSAGRRDRLAQRLRLPPHMSANALLEAVNLLYSKEEYDSALAAVTEEEQV